MTVDYYKVLCRMVDKGLTTVEEVRMVVKEIKAETQTENTDEAERLCNLLNQAIINNGWIPFHLTDAMIGEMDSLLREGHEPALIEKVIDWAIKDDFWSMNVLNPAKLRKHFQTLVAKAEKASKALEEAAQRRAASFDYSELERRRAEAVPKPAHLDLKTALRSQPKNDVEVE
jgi:polyhydroxyalkanoate synthesis regulator phasin